MAMALTRAFARSAAETLGNFWVDLTRATLYVLLPLSIIVALVFVAMGLPQTLDASVTATTLEGGQQTLRSVRSPARRRSSSLAPMAAASSTSTPPILSRIRPHSPTYLNIFAMLGVSAALVYAFGQMVGDRRQGWAFLAAIGILLIAGVGVIYWAEVRRAIRSSPRSALDPVARQHGGQGGPLRPGHAALYAATTTGLSDGGVNAMHGSLTGLGGLVPMFLIQLGEVLPGGVGSGLYGLVIFAILSVFVAGLMVGRTPELLGKKIEAAK
jgi:K+-transporting ATPase ATPase A chain